LSQCWESGRKLGAGNSGYGLLLGAYGIGGLIGAILTGRMSGPVRWRPTLIAALLLVATMLVIVGSVPNLFEALAASLLLGGGMVVGEALSDTALPRMLDDDVLARACGLAFPASLGGIVLGSLLAAPLISLLGTAGLFTASGVAVLVVCGLLTRGPLVAAAVPAPGRFSFQIEG
jgi:MFS family permease